MSFSDDAKKVLTVTGYALDGLEIVGKLAKGALGARDLGARDQGAPPELSWLLAVLAAIAQLHDSVADALSGKRSLSSVEDDLALLRSALAANEQAARDAIDAKFPR